MPYIKKELREALVEGELPSNVGELNFKITELLCEWIADKGLSYNTCNDAIGALESAKLEFYRRVVVPYEEQKRFENGDVYSV